MNNVGFVNIYPYRPHAHHSFFLEQQLKKEFPKIKTFSLNCSGHANTCYLRELKGTGKSECLKCTLGGVNSFDFDFNEDISSYISNNVIDFDYLSLVQSSSYTLARIESDIDRECEDVIYYQNLLLEGARDTFNAAVNWLKSNKIELLVLFNGRMDYTRAALEAAKYLGIPCITHERPLFGHGIVLNLNDNCSSLKNIHNINDKFRDKPLTEEQVLYAASLLSQRFVGKNDLEWKKYNNNPNSVDEWPTITKRKILVCPSSKNELLGHPDWSTPWKNNTDALDVLLSSNQINASELIVRFHPSWAVNFGQNNADKCVQHYRDWCEKRNVFFIPSDSAANTRDLIILSDVVILNGSNTILEAGALGKPVVCLGSSPYTYSQAAKDVLSYDDLHTLSFDEIIKRDPRSIIKSTLRYVYNKAKREPLFFDSVRSQTVIECEYFDSVSTLEFSRILSREFIVGDYNFSTSDEVESTIVDRFINFSMENMAELSSFDLCENDSKLNITRRGLYKMVDKLRKLNPKGV